VSKGRAHAGYAREAVMASRSTVSGTAVRS
jgi:hypothetical protein